MCQFRINRGFSITKVGLPGSISTSNFFASHFFRVLVVRNMTIQLSNELNPIFPFPTTLLGILDEKARKMS